MAGGIRREGRSEVWAVEVAGRRAQGREPWIGYGVRVPIAHPSRPHSGVGFPDAGDGPPDVVVVLRFPNGDSGIGHRYVDQSEQTRDFEITRAHFIGDGEGNLVVESGRRAQTRSAVVGPVNPDVGLLWRALRRRNDTIASEAFYFIESASVFGAAHRRRRRRAELIG